jgi:cell division protein FtsX
MSTFIITCEHEAEECADLDREMQEIGVAEVIKGKDFFCACPYGYHGGWVAVEGSDAESILALLPPVFRSHAHVYQIEAVRFE